ncbi:MAG TPA: hypothetical protein VFU31_05465 [Candidatus Binatia bacterium]|nr:hypothetical protein [Candidatus Binatia bacterium]
MAEKSKEITAEKAAAKAEERAAVKAEATAKAVDTEVNAQAEREEAEALKVSKATEIQEGQVWEELEHENPFELIMRATVAEVRANRKGDKYIKFKWAPESQPDRASNFEYVTEKEFRERFPKFVAWRP